MNGQFRTAAIAGICGFALATATQLFAQHDMHNMGKSPAQMEPGAMQIHQMMVDMGKQITAMKMPMEKNTDKMFALSMAMHHGDGIKMAKVELKYGKNAALKAIAKKIVSGQSAEKAKLEQLAKGIK